MGLYFLKERKPNAGLEFFLRGLSLVNPSKNTDLSIQLYSMAGFAAFKSGDCKKSNEFNLACLDVIKSFPKEDSRYAYYEAVCYFNLSVSHSLMYQRADSEVYISKALDIVMRDNIDELKNRIIPFYEEYFGEIEISDENVDEQSPQKMEFNFLPGAPETVNNKIVELRCETPKERKRNKNSKRSLSRA